MVENGILVTYCTLNCIPMCITLCDDGATITMYIMHEYYALWLDDYRFSNE